MGNSSSANSSKKSKLSLTKKIQSEIEDTKILFRSIPSLTFTFFAVSLISANLMANKELLNYKFVALDCGYVFSWIMFLCMDVICKKWGAKASIKVSLSALLIDLAVCAIFFILSLFPGFWGEAYNAKNEEEMIIVNNCLNQTFGGSWYVVLGSATAFIISSIINAILNSKIGERTKSKGFGEFALRSYVSTIIAQLADNLTFSTLVSKIFFGWTWTQVFVCSLIGAFFELFFEIVFSGIGYKILQKWEKEKVGQEYFEYLKNKNEF